MADYRSCAWYQKATCIRYDKSGAPISCADCEDYERRVIFKIEDLQERNGEMSVRKSCSNCKHNKIGICHFGNVIGGMPCKTTAMEYWELADDAKADVLHDDKPQIIRDESILSDEDKEALIKAIKNAPIIMLKESEYDAVSHPAHYMKGGIECIDCIKSALGENFIGFLIGNVIKYTYRYKDKNGVENLKKARWYLDRAIKELEETLGKE